MIDKKRVHDAADLHELLPLPTVTGKPRDLACRHGSHPSQADFGYTFSRIRFVACRPPRIVRGPRRSPRSLASRGAAIVVACRIAASDFQDCGSPDICRRLSHVEDGLAIEVLRLDLLHASLDSSARWARNRREANVPREEPPCDAHPSAIIANPASTDAFETVPTASTWTNGSTGHQHFLGNRGRMLIFYRLLSLAALQLPKEASYICKVGRSNTGSAAARMARQEARSSIHCGSSSPRPLSSPSSRHRQTE